MANVYVEPRPKRRPEGPPIDDYVVEDHADHVLKTPAKLSMKRSHLQKATGIIPLLLASGT